MPPFVEEDRFKTTTDSYKNTGGTVATDTDLVVVEVDFKAQLSNLRITGATSELYDVVVRDQDGTNPTTEKSFVGSDLNEGNFESPALRNIGAQKEVVVINRTGLADDNYAVNIEVDEAEAGVAQ